MGLSVQVNMMAPDGRRLDTDCHLNSAAMALSALAASGFAPDVLRLFMVPGLPVAALTPAECEAMAAALKVTLLVCLSVFLG